MRPAPVLLVLWLGIPRAQAQAPVSLPARIQGYVDAGRSAAGEGRWQDAAVSYGKAQQWAFAHPMLLHDLGVVHERAGNRPAAALWWRAYLTLEPRAPDAPALEGRIARIALELEFKGRAQLERAFEAASVLSSEREPKQRSGRRGALNDVLRDAYHCAPQDLADALRARARRLSPADPEPADIQNLRTAGGIYGAAYRMDERSALRLRAKLAGGDAGDYDAMLAWMYARMGRPAEAARALAAPGVFNQEVVYERLESQEAFVEQRAYLLGELGKKEAFDEDLFSRAVASAGREFWAGDRGGAVRLAEAALAHLERFDPLLDPVFLSPRAFIGRMAAWAMTSRFDELERIIRVEELLPRDPDRWYDRIVPLAAARDVSRARTLRAAVLEGDTVWNSPDALDLIHFTARAAIDFAAGVEGEAVDRVSRMAPSGANDDLERVRMLLTIAAAYGRVDSALAASEWVASGMDASQKLRRLAEAASGAGRERALAQLRRMYGGREPLAREREMLLIGRLLEARNASASPGKFDAVPGTFDDVLAKTPEKLPATLSDAACRNLLTANAALLR